MDESDEDTVAEAEHETTAVELPADEQDLIDRLEAEKGRELTEQERNLAVAQAGLIGDL